MKVQWWPSATLALLGMPRADAEAIDRAVERWAASGEGIVVASDGGVFLLFVGGHVVEFVVTDTAADTMHVERVRRA
jgi:hypothetical protein